MPKYILMRADGLYLGETNWVQFAEHARQFDAEEISVEKLRHTGSFAWRVNIKPPHADGYAPERTTTLPEFRETCFKAAA